MDFMNIQHSSRSDCWYTPPAIIEMARNVLQVITFDPASDAFGQETVAATGYLTEQDDGLATPWPLDPQSVWLNPPGGKVGNRSKTQLFWSKLMDYRAAGRLKHAIFMAFSVEALQNTQGKGAPGIMDFPFCVPSRRVQFISRGVEKFQPSHSNAIVYVPGLVDRTTEFRDVFSALGAVKL